MAKILDVVLPDNRPETGLLCKEKTLTQQSMADECDINKIIKKYEQSGLVTHVNERVAQYGDFSDGVDFQAAMNVVTQANEMFMGLPAHVRERFDNDPAKMVKFLSDERNAEEAVELGLAVAKPQKGDNTPGNDNRGLKEAETGLPEGSAPTTPAPKGRAKSGGDAQ